MIKPMTRTWPKISKIRGSDLGPGFAGGVFC
jgi:hypothetical protein